MLINRRPSLAYSIRQFGGYLLAVGLLISSVWYALRGRQLEDWAILREADPWLIVGFFATIIVSAIVVPGIQFWLVTRPFVIERSLSLVSMQALTAAGGLLNYTPFKAGMIGRIAYLKHFHGVGYRAAALTHVVIVVAFVSSSLLTILVTVWRGGFDILWWAASLTGIGILAGVTAPILRAAIPSDLAVDPRLRSTMGALGAYMLPCFAAQLLGLFFTALRWWIVFHILDRPIALADAWMAAVVHLVAVMAGPANGVGLREWLIGFGGEQGGLQSGLKMDLQVGVSAALIDRAAEAVVLILFGLLALAFLRYVQGRPGNIATGHK